MITQIRLKNFQKHKLLTINLDRHVTSLIGPTDVGKSAIVRALKWLCLNKPPRGNFVRRGSDNVSVSIQLEASEGAGSYPSDDRCASISRSRSKRGNRYRVTNSSGRTRTLNAVGRTSPRLISNYLQVHPASFQGQHEQSFWFHRTPGDVAKQLNEIVDLSLIDRTLKNLGSVVRKKQTELEIKQGEVTRAQEAKESLAWVREAEEEFEGLLLLERRSLAKASRKGALASLLEKGRMALDSYASASLAAQEALELKEGAANSLELERKAIRLGNLIRALEQARRLARPAPDLGRLEELLGRRDQINRLSARLLILTHAIESAETKQCDLQKEFGRETQKLASLPNCPRCGQPMK